MGMTVQHDRGNDQLHLIFREDKILADTEWCASNAVISFAYDRTPVEITIYNYYSNPKWEFDEAFVEKYELLDHLDDLRLVWENFFAPKSYAVKSIHFEGPDGNEVIVSPGQEK
jgi:hypothetical protein